MRALAFAMTLLAAPAVAQDHAAIVNGALDGHILPGFARLAEATAALDDAATAFCDGGADRARLDVAYHAAFDAWMGVSHLRFGPLEAQNRGAAIAFWPDARGTTPRTLARMLADADPVARDPAAFADASVAARGLMALDWLLFDESAPPPQGYACTLVAAVAADLARTAAAADADWRTDYADRMRRGDGAVYQTPAEAVAELRKAFAGGLQATADLRVGRPMGGDAGPRPRLAEAWRSDRPMRNVALSLAALAEMAEAAFAPALTADEAAALRTRFAAARAAADAAPRPLTAALETDEGRAALRRLAQQLALLRAFEELTVAPALGAGLGFNAMDGD